MFLTILLQQNFLLHITVKCAVCLKTIHSNHHVQISAKLS